MAAFRSPLSSFPDSLRDVLQMRSADLRCPASVEAALAAIPYFKERGAPAAAAAAPKPGGRFSHIVQVSASSSEDGFRRTGWRSLSTTQDEDGFQTVRGAGGRFRRHHDTRYTSASSRTHVEPAAAAAAVARPVVSQEETVARFSSAAVKASEDVEGRILSRIKGKINKIGPSTYDATKVFMQQILNSEETGFLDEFMKFVFQKAATESAFCGLYARLLHELADEFTHLRTVMEALLHAYTDIFTEVEGTPDVGSDNYAAFLDAQERKKFRRGYSQFIAELVKLGEADKKEFATIIDKIVTVLETRHLQDNNALLCEEYIDCLSNLCGCASVLSTAAWAGCVRQRLAMLASKPRKDVPGITNKARFALMDLVEKAKREWSA